MLQRLQSQFFVRCEGKDTFSLLLRGCSVKLARLNILTYFSLNVPQKYIKIYKISIIIYKRDAISAACVRPFLPISSLLLILLLVFVFVMPGPGHLPPGGPSTATFWRDLYRLKERALPLLLAIILRIEELVYKIGWQLEHLCNLVGGHLIMLAQQYGQPALLIVG